LLLGTIPIDFTRLVGLMHMDICFEPSLEGLNGYSLSFPTFEKIGEFPLVEGCFPKLIGVDLPYDCSFFPIFSSF